LGFKYEELIPLIKEMLSDNSPLSTGMIAKELESNWFTVQRALMEMLNESSVEHRKIAGRLLWWLKE